MYVAQDMKMRRMGYLYAYLVLVPLLPLALGCNTRGGMRHIIKLSSMYDARFNFRILLTVLLSLPTRHRNPKQQARMIPLRKIWHWT